MIVDYAYSILMAEKAIKRVHAAMLNKDHDEALEAALDALVEMRLTYNAIKHDREIEDATNAKRDGLA
jgi:hypothetical protein